MTARNPFDPTNAAPTAPVFPTEPVQGGASVPTAQGIVVGSADPAYSQAPPPAQAQAPLPGQPQVDAPFNPFGNPGNPASASDDDFVIDLTGVESSGGRQDFIGVGEHLGFCSDVVKQTSKAGNPMLVFTFTVYRGEYAGKSRKLYCSLTASALWKLDETLNALGFKLGDDRKLSIAAIKEGAKRTLVTMEIVEGEPYNGRPTTDFARVSPPGDLEPGTKIGVPGVPS